MGKVLKIFGMIFVMLIVGFVGLIFWAHGEGTELQEKFFVAVESDDPDKLMELLHPELHVEIDRPVLKMWMDGVKEKLGKHQGLSNSNFSTSSKSTSRGKLVESKGTALFEKGEASVHLRALDGKLEFFQMKSDLIKGSEWFRKPEGDLYRDRAKKLVEFLMTGKASEVTPMIHEKLQEKVEIETLQTGMAKLRTSTGEMKSIQVVSEDLVPGDSPSLTVKMTVECEKKTFEAEVQFQFLGLKGHILAYQVPSD